MLDGAARVKDVVAAAAADQQPAVAITDHGVLYGVVDFYRAATAAGVKPILGMEAYLTPGSRFDRPARGGTRYHLTLLAENETGYRNLMKLSSRAYLEGFFYKPRMDFDLLAEYAQGIIATSGCLGGPVAQLLAPDASREEGNDGAVGDFRSALAEAARLQDIFGRDGFFIEIQDHGMEAQARVNPDLVAIAGQLGAPLLATNDAHYTRRDEAEAHDVLLCIQTGAVVDEPNRLKFDAAEFYLKNAAEMRALFADDLYPKACDNTLWVAERANVDLEFGQILLPQFPVPAGKTEMAYLEELVYQGATIRYGDPLPDTVRDRIGHELRIIEQMGFPAYFLIVWDLIRYARERRIRVGPGRGSAAGSIVAYCLRITDLDPLTYGLIFERFLNPGRRQMPDIDMDFDERYRSEVIRYAAEKYGSDHVAQIVTFSTIKGRQAIRDAARVFGYPYGLGDRVAKLLPPSILGKDASLKECLEPPPPGAEAMTKDWYSNAAGLRQAYEAEAEVRRVVDAARQLEGLRRQDSIHAAAVVISPVPLMELVPVQQKGPEAEIVTQYEMGGIEALGLLKMDFLGLRNLSIIERAVELIEQTTGVRVDIDSVPLDDPATFELLQAGDSIGVFQLEGGPMRSLMRSLRPDRFEDVVALVALYRPGPMGAGMHTLYADRKNGRSAIAPLHPEVEEVLADTFGIMVYQEQVMQVAERMAGYTMEEADNLRKAMGKKIKSVMNSEEEKFIKGVITRGHDEKTGKELFALIEHFAGYGFNRSHSAAYGLIAYQTAWLKSHHPAEYLASLLTATKRDKDRTAVYLNECRTTKIEVLVPDVNHSHADFTVHEGKIRFGLAAIRNVGEGVVEKIVEARNAGSFTDFDDFVNRVDQAVLNKRTVESLVKAGAFDALGHSRRGLTLVFESMLDAVLERRRNEEMGQFSLFTSTGEESMQQRIEIPSDEWPQKTLLSFEKEMLGLFISDHPLLAVGSALRSSVSTAIPGLWELKDGEPVVVGGLVGGISRRYTKKGEPMLFFQLEDLEGSVEVIAFPSVVAQSGPMVVEDAVLIVSGRLDHRGDEVKVMAREIADVRASEDRNLRLKVPAKKLSADVVGRIKDILSNHPGTSPVYLHMTKDGGEKVLKLSDEYRVQPRSALYAELQELLGRGAVQ